MTPPTAAGTARPELVTEHVPRRRQAWIERATSSDHKSVGMMYIGAALTFGLTALTALVVMRVQLIVPENTTIDPEIFNRVMSSFAVTGVVLFAIPLALGLFSYIAPLQVGARGVAFPRLNLMSFWLYVAGGFTIYGSFLWRPSEAGFAALPPLSEPLYSNTHGVDAWIVGTALAVLGFVPAVGAALALFGVIGSLTGLLLFLTPWRITSVLILTVAMCMVSGAMAVRRVSTADPAEVF